MKTILNYQKKTLSAWTKASIALFIYLLLVITSSCQKYENNLPVQEFFTESNPILTAEFCRTSPHGEILNLYYGHKIFFRSHGEPVVKTQIIENPNFHCYDGNFVLKINNGRDKRTRVSSAEIKIDGVLIVGPSDFSKNISFITKKLTGLNPESILEVKLNSSPGSFIDLWIEGTLIVIKPTFDEIGPICQNNIAPELPLSSNNTPSITGTWNPAIINTSIAGITTYTFTPVEGRCASAIKMDIEVINPTTPIFTQIGPLNQGSFAPVFPITSNNGIAGTWSPSTISTVNPGTFTYIFTPEASQCASTATMEIVVSSDNMVSDIDGNTYKIIKIGNQWWMAENIKVTKYRNGDLIGTTNPATLDISNETLPEYQWAYDGEENNAGNFGRLYTWYTATDTRSVCPSGWHVPASTEWTTLTNYLMNNGYGYEGSGSDIAKSLAAKSGWRVFTTPGYVGDDQESNNSSGFTALPGGYRFSNGTFVNIGDYASWWSASDLISTGGEFWSIHYNRNYVKRDYSSKNQGMAIRCIRD